MVIGKPAPFVSAFVDAVDDAIRAHHPSHAMSATQRAWLAFCVTAVLVTNSICWARFERASLGTYALAALSWMFRHSKMPWDQLLVASVRVILRHHGLTSGSLVIDDTDNPRSKSAKALAHLYKLRDKESGGYLWGQSLVFLVLVTPKISIPVGFVFYQPAPELSAWYKKDKALKKQGVPTKQRPPKPAPNPQYPTKEQLALRLLETVQGPTSRCPGSLYHGGCALWHGDLCRWRLGPVSVACKSSRKSAAIRTFASASATSTSPTILPPIPGRPTPSASEAVKRWWRWSGVRGCMSAPTKPNGSSWRIKYAEEETYRYLIASDLSWRTLDIVQGHTLRWLVEVFIQDWKSYEGWSQLTKQPGEEGARHSVILSLLVDHSLFVHPDQQRPA